MYASGAAQMVTSGVKDALRANRATSTSSPTTTSRRSRQRDRRRRVGAGLATFSGDRILEVFYPEPKLGEQTIRGRAS